MWKGENFGSNSASTRITGTARQGTCSNSASAMRVKTLALAAPPRDRMASRARTMCGASGSSPASFSA